MSTIVNDRDVLLQAAGTRLLTVALPTNQTVDFSLVNGATKPSNNADVTVTAINSTVSASSGGLTLSSTAAIKGGQTAYDTGTGFFLGGASAQFSVGNSAGNKLTWNGSALGIVGAITGNSSINITGTANFSGLTSAGGFNFAVVGNSASNASSGGVYGIGGTSAPGINGFANNSSGSVRGDTTTGNAVVGQASGSGVGGFFSTSTGAVALQVSGPMAITSSTLVTNLNANFLQGTAASAFLGVSATAADSSSLGGFGSGAWIRQTGSTAGNPGTAFTHVINAVSGGVAFRIPVFVP